MSDSYQSWPDHHPVIDRAEMRMILVVGADLEMTRAAAMHLFDAGHLPLMAGWFSELHDVLHPLSERLLARCDAVLCVDGPSRRDDALVGLARARGLRVFFDLKEALDG
jgi:hypothetical protein